MPTCYTFEPQATFGLTRSPTKMPSILDRKMVDSTVIARNDSTLREARFFLLKQFGWLLVFFDAYALASHPTFATHMIMELNSNTVCSSSYRIFTMKTAASFISEVENGHGAGAGVPMKILMQMALRDIDIDVDRDLVSNPSGRTDSG